MEDLGAGTVICPPSALGGGKYTGDLTPGLQPIWQERSSRNLDPSWREVVTLFDHADQSRLRFLGDLVCPGSRPLPG